MKDIKSDVLFTIKFEEARVKFTIKLRKIETGAKMKKTKGEDEICRYFFAYIICPIAIPNNAEAIIIKTK